MEYTKISKKMKSPVDGLELDLLILVPEEAPKGILQIHHGMAEYKERYLPFMKYFAEAGYVAAIHDCRGHGKSVRTKKDLGYMYGAGMDALIEDTAEVTRMLKEEWQGVPLILLGHSMGSMVVRCFTKKYDDLLNMLVVCGSPSKNPGAKIGIALAAVQEKISGAHHVSRFLELLSLGSYSGKFAGEGSRFAWCCSDEQVVRAYEASELCGFTFTVDADQVLFQLMDETYRETGWKLFNPDLPVLFIGGYEDPCIGGARKFAQAVQTMRRVGYMDTKGKLYPGMRHEILNEREKEKVYHDVKKYIANQANGDLRFAYSLVEFCYNGFGNTFSIEDIKTINNNMNFFHDKNEDGYYDVISAFQKSIRGSDVDAAIHYLMRLIEAGDFDIIYRRMLVIAYEDIGLANPNMPIKVLTAIEAAERIGLPELYKPLTSVVIDMALSPKSNTIEQTYAAAINDLKKGNVGRVPKHIRTYNENLYKYPHNYKNHWVKQQYLPDNIINSKYYYPGDNKYEMSMYEFNKKIKGE